MTTLWKPKTFEDQLLHAYWLKVGGQIYLEVPIGGPGGPGDGPPGSKRRRIDGVRLDGPNPQAGSVRFNNYAAQFSTVIKDRPVELIEAKKKLNRLVIGQALADLDTFTRQYQAGQIKPVILCAQGDPALEWVCQQRQILVQIVELN